MYSSWKILLIVTILLQSCSANPTESEPADLSILFVGNSLTYTNDLPKILERLLAYSDLPSVEVKSIARANYGLEDHWVLGSARSEIAKGGWDVVILQQGPSATEGRPSLLSYSKLFNEEIRAVGAVPALYMVWPSIQRFFDFEGVSNSYAAAAESVEGLLFPAGEAWRSAWRLDPNLALYGDDGFHPSRAGSYLAAVVMYEQLANRDPRDLPADAARLNLPEALTGLLHEAAAEANKKFSRSRSQIQ